MKSILICVFILFLTPIILNGQQTAGKFSVDIKYLLYLPKHYPDDSSAKWPLVMFLHGSGESGQNIDSVKKHGPPELVEKGKQFPFILVSPQSEVPNGWDVDYLYKLLQHIKRTLRVDNDKVYLTGLSMGGFGTWAMAMKYPQEFAAIIPVCGGGDTSTAWKLRNIPVWCFHGAKDNVVPPINSINMVKAASLYNAGIKFTLYPEANHNSWDKTYNNDSVYTWMLSQTKFRYKEVPLSVETLRQYEGYYVGPDQDTVQLVVTTGRLTARVNGQVIPLLPASTNLFFINPELSMDLRFSAGNKRAPSFIFFGDRKLVYRRVKT
ncbi:MAG: prolyl oligopeptidase family serine peptidase [Candidatus Dadabacteria bacterium]